MIQNWPVFCPWSFSLPSTDFRCKQPNWNIGEKRGKRSHTCLTPRFLWFGRKSSGAGNFCTTSANFKKKSSKDFRSLEKNQKELCLMRKRHYTNKKRVKQALPIWSMSMQKDAQHRSSLEKCQSEPQQKSWHTHQNCPDEKDHSVRGWRGSEAIWSCSHCWWECR